MQVIAVLEIDCHAALGQYYDHGLLASQIIEMEVNLRKHRSSREVAMDTPCLEPFQDQLLDVYTPYIAFVSNMSIHMSNCLFLYHIVILYTLGLLEYHFRYKPYYNSNTIAV